MYLPRTHIAIVTLLFGMALLSSCRDMGTDPTPSYPVASVPSGSPGAISFRTQVEPIFQQYRCVSCHGGNGGLVLTSYAALMAGGNHGPVIVPGNAAGSHIIVKLTLAPPPFGSRMPLGGPYLADSVVEVITTWINQGALNN